MPTWQEDEKLLYRYNQISMLTSLYFHELAELANQLAGKTGMFILKAKTFKGLSLNESQHRELDKSFSDLTEALFSLKGKVSGL